MTTKYHFSKINALLMEEAMKKIALLSIRFYQNFISPRKGFRCAYGVVNDTYGCSGHVKEIIDAHGLLKGIPLIKNQFKQCKQASIELKKRKNNPKKKSRKCNDVVSNCCIDPDISDCCVDHDCCNVFDIFN